MKVRVKFCLNIAILKEICIIPAFLVVFLAFAACNNPTTPGTVTVTGISLNKVSTSLLVGSTETLFVAITPTNATNQNVTWISNDTAVATISTGGVVTGLSDGTAIITVTSADGGKAAFCTVTVSNVTVSVTGVSLNKASTSLLVGGTETLFVAITPTNATNQNVTWISDSPTVVTVSTGGVVTGVSAGTATITVTTADGGKTAFCTVTVSNVAVSVTGISLNKTSASLAVGESETLFAAITPTNATNQNVTWISGNPAVAMVSADGTIIGVSAGTATITVTTADGGKTAFCTVTIVNDGTPVAVLTGSRYQADPYTGTDKIKYSYRYNGYDFYYIYLGQLRNIPLFYGNNYQHTWDTTSYTYKFSKTNSTTISNTVTKSSQEVVSISNEHTASTTSEYKFHEEINANFKVFGIGTEIKVSADQNFKNYASNTSTFQQTTSLTNTVTYGTSQTESTQESASITLTRADKPGWYRYTFFSASDVYLYVVRDPAKPDEIYYEFRENVIPGLNFWKMDYSPTPDFNKNDATRFGVDISMLKNLPTPELKFITIPMVYVPGGSFQMGKELGTTGSGDFSPVHPVTLNGFYMGKYQVTQAQYEAVMGSNPSYFSSNPASGEVQGNRPVENVSWYDAIVFCNKLSMAEGLNPAYSISGNTNPSDWGIVPTSSNSTWNSAVIVAGSNGYRLPTEAQWEYAAKGGNGTPGNYTYAGSNNIDEVAWYIDNSNSMTHEVGKKPPNGLGLYDMSGNVWEWCWDWYGYYSNEAQTDPQGSTAGDFRVLRGGCCLYVNHNDASSVHRGIYPPSGRTSPHGFRLVRP